MKASVAPSNALCIPGVSLHFSTRLERSGAERTYRAIDEDPQMFASNSLQVLPIVQLSQDNFILYDVVLQDNPEQPLVLGHKVI